MFLLILQKEKVFLAHIMQSRAIQHKVAVQGIINTYIYQEAKAIQCPKRHK